MEEVHRWNARQREQRDSDDGLQRWALSLSQEIDRLFLRDEQVEKNSIYFFYLTGKIIFFIYFIFISLDVRRGERKIGSLRFIF